MAIKRTQEVPSEFPPARFYLEDIEDIEMVFRDACRKKSAESPSAIMTRFGVGEVECDTIEELRGIAKSVSDFWVQVKLPAHFATLTLSTSDGCRWYALGIPDDERWAIYGKLRSIVEPRIIRWKNLIRQIPVWVYGLLLLLSLVLKMVYGDRPAPPLRGWPLVAGLSFVALFVLVVYSVYFQHTVVELRYKRDSGAVANAVKSWLPYLIAAGVGGVATVIAQRLLNLLWPVP